MNAAPTAPGAYVNVASAAPAQGQAPNTGTWFVSGEAQMGPVGVAIPITSMSDYAQFLGSRNSYTTLYDSLDEFFHDGGQLAYVSRIVGATPVSASLVLMDQGGTPQSTLTVTANGGGVWGNSCTVKVVVTSGTYVITITNTLTGQIWVSPTLSVPQDAVTWAANLSGVAPWAFPFTITNNGSTNSGTTNNPANLSATALASGADNLGGVTETQWTNALTAFVSDLGPGQLSAPGHTTEAGWLALIASAGQVDGNGYLINNRVALLDDVDSATAANIVTDAGEAQSAGDPSYGFMGAPWVIIPGVPATVNGVSPVAATRVVPPSALMAALMARSDQSNNSGVPAAGPNGVSQYAIGVTQTYNETDRGSLNSAGVCVIKNSKSSGVELYGYQSLSTNPAWTSGASVRLRMQLTSLLRETAKGFAFAQIDGQGKLLSHFAGSLSGICQQLWQEGALFGDTAADAFTVNVGPQVNTPQSLQSGQLNAIVSVRISPYAEFVTISVVSYPITQSIPA